MTPIFAHIEKMWGIFVVFSIIMCKFADEINPRLTYYIKICFAT